MRLSVSITWWLFALAKDVVIIFVFGYFVALKSLAINCSRDQPARHRGLREGYADACARASTQRSTNQHTAMLFVHARRLRQRRR